MRQVKLLNIAHPQQRSEPMSEINVSTAAAPMASAKPTTRGGSWLREVAAMNGARP